MKNLRIIGITVGLLGLSLLIYSAQAMGWQKVSRHPESSQSNVQMSSHREPIQIGYPSSEPSNKNQKKVLEQSQKVAQEMDNLAKNMQKEAKSGDAQQKSRKPHKEELSQEQKDIKRQIQEIHKGDVNGQIKAAVKWLEERHAQGIRDGTIDPATELKKLFPSQMKAFENSPEGKEWLAQQQKLSEERIQSIKKPQKEPGVEEINILQEQSTQNVDNRLADEEARKKAAEEEARKKRIDEWFKPAKQEPERIIEEKEGMSKAKIAAIGATATGVGLTAAGTAAAGLITAGGAAAALAGTGGEAGVVAVETAGTGVSLTDDIAGSAIGFEEL